MASPSLPHIDLRLLAASGCDEKTTAVTSPVALDKAARLFSGPNGLVAKRTESTPALFCPSPCSGPPSVAHSHNFSPLYPAKSLQTTSVDRVVVNVVICRFRQKSSKLKLLKRSSLILYATIDTASRIEGTWLPVGRADVMKSVLPIQCFISDLKTRIVHVSFFQYEDGSAPDAKLLGSCIFRMADLFDPSKQCGSKGGAGPLLQAVYAPEVRRTNQMQSKEKVADSFKELGQVLIGTAELRGVIVTSFGPNEKFGLELSFQNGISVRKEVKGSLLHVTRIGGRRQPMPIAELELKGRGQEGYASLEIDEEIICFGLNENGMRTASLRFEWVRPRSINVFKSSAKDRVGHVFTSLDLRIEQMLLVKAGDHFTLNWRSAPTYTPATRLVVVNHASFADRRLKLKLALTR